MKLRVGFPVSENTSLGFQQESRGSCTPPGATPTLQHRVSRTVGMGCAFVHSHLCARLVRLTDEGFTSLAEVIPVHFFSSARL